MSLEITGIVEAINGLKTNPDYIKDYVYPVVLSVLAALFGGWAGYQGIRRKESDDYEKEKVDAANFWLMEAIDCFHNLATIKGNYASTLTDNPFQRITIPYIVMDFPKLNINVTNLIFLVSADKKIENIKEDRLKFDNIVRIRGMLQNYNTALNMWEKRNELALPLIEKIVSDHSESGGPADISHPDQIFQSIGGAKLRQLVHLTEAVIALTDELLKEVHDFMTEFPDICKGKIDEKYIKRYGPILRYQNDSATLGPILNRVRVNEAILNELLQTS